MDHMKALAIKGVMTFITLWLVLNLGFGVSLTNVVILTLVLGAVSYLTGDLYILAKSSNMTATMADIGLTFLIIWLLGMALTTVGAGTMALAAAISTIVIAIGEYLFHFYVSRKGLGANKSHTFSHSH